MGRPKAWLPIGGETLLERVVATLSRVVEPIVIVGAPGQDLPLLSHEVTIVRDAVQGRGPLQGLSAGLRAIAPSAEAAYVSSCDVPLLQEAFVRLVVGSLGDNDVAVPFTEARHHPLAAAYRTRVVDEVDRLLAANRLRPIFLFEAVRTRILSEEELRRHDPKLDSLRNVNTPEEFQAALAELGISESR
jgi:molybdopterin-guanine dinucleotide biosynthesis protein A